MRRLALIGMMIIILLALATGGALIYLNSTFGGQHLLSIINEMALKEAGLELKWENARGSFLFNLTVDRPVLITSAGDTLVQASDMRIRFMPWSVLEGGIELTRVDADKVLVDIRAITRGSTNREKPASADTAVSEKKNGIDLRIRNVTIRDGSVRIVEGGIVNSVKGMRIRGGMRLGGGGGLVTDLQRVRAEIDDWGMIIEDMRGQVILNRGFLWLIGTEIRTSGSQLSANGNLDLSGGRKGKLRLDLRAGDLEEWWPVTGGSWAGRGPVVASGYLRGRPWEPEIDVRGNGTLAGIRLDRFELKGRYLPENLEAELFAAGPTTDSLVALLDLNPRTGDSYLTVQADSLRLRSSPAVIPIDAESLRLIVQTSSYDPISTGGYLSIIAGGVDLYGLKVDSTRADLELGEGSITTVQPLYMDGYGYVLDASGDISFENRAVNMQITGSTQEPSDLFAPANLELKKGNVELNARITGLLTDPSLRGGMKISDLERKGVSVAGATFDFDVSQVLGARIGRFEADLDSLHIDSGLDILGGMLDGRIIGDEVTLKLVSGYWEDGNISMQGNISVGSDSVRARLDHSLLQHKDIDIRNISGWLTFDPHTGAGPFSVLAGIGEGSAVLTGHRDEDHRLFLEGDLRKLDIGPFTGAFLDSTTLIEGVVDGHIRSQIETHLEVLSAGITIDEPTAAGHLYRQLTINALYDNGTIDLHDFRVLGDEVEGVSAESALITGNLILPGFKEGLEDGLLDLDLVLERVDLAAFQNYLGESTLKGEFSSQMALSGTFGAPSLRGDFRFSETQIDTFEIAEARADIRYDNGRLRIENGRLESVGYNADFDGSIPLQLSILPVEARIVTDGDIRASLRGRGEPAAIIQPFRRQFERAEGDLNTDVSISGTLEELKLDGNVRLRNALLKPAVLGQPIEDIQLDLRLSEGVIEVATFTGRMPSGIREKTNLFSLIGRLFKRRRAGGEFSVTGNMVLGEEGKVGFDLNLEGNGMGISDPTGSLALLMDSDLTLTTLPGNSYPTLSGTVQVIQGLADVGMLLNLLGGTESTARISEEEEKEGLEANVEIEIPGRLRVIGGVAGQDVDVELMGNLLFRKYPVGAPYLLGSLESVPGRGQLFMFGQKWVIEEGTVTFGTIEEINPDLNARFTTIVQTVPVIYTLTGNVREPMSELSSEDNTLSTSDIGELLTVGKIGFGDQAGGTQELVGSYLEHAVSRRVSGLLGVDTLELEGMTRFAQGTVSEDTRVSVGRYFGNRIYGKFAYLGGTVPRWEGGLEYRISRWFILGGTYDRQGRFVLELKWRIEY